MIYSSDPKSDLTLHDQSFATLIQRERFYGERIASVMRALAYDTSPNLSKIERKRLAQFLGDLSHDSEIEGMDFSRAQLTELLATREAGGIIEFETLGPYLADYVAYGGRITESNLTPEDVIGLTLATVARHFLPSARLISLYDDYNLGKMNVGDTTPEPFHHTQINTFKQSLVELFSSVEVIPKNAQSDKDYLLIAESSKVKDAEALVQKLDSEGLIVRHGEELVYSNPIAENPLNQDIRLRNGQGKWLCQALDAAGFLKASNQDIVHLIVLPDYMKAQQDQVWEILRALGIPSQRYHNIFYDPAMSAKRAAEVLFSAFSAADKHLKLDRLSQPQ